MSVSVTDVTRDCGDLNIRGVPREVLTAIKHAAIEEGLSLKDYVVHVLESAASADLDTFEVKTRAWQVARYRQFR